MNETVEPPDTPKTPVPPEKEKEFHTPFDPADGLEDGRKPWDWRSKFPDITKPLIKREAWIVLGYFVFFFAASALSAAIQGNKIVLGDPSFAFTIDPKLLLIFFVGGMGGTTFSIKWLMHSVATGKWHIDRIYWRIFVPLVSGVYALVVLHLFGGGMIGAARPLPTDIGGIAALAFLVGYFSDGVSGLLTNIANAVFGTVQKK